MYCISKRVVSILLLSSCLGIGTSLVAPSAEAQTIIDWTAGAATDYYFSTTNWAGSDIPNDITETAQFNLAGVYKVTLKFSSTTTVSDLHVFDGEISFSADAVGAATYNIDDDLLISGATFSLTDDPAVDDVHINVNDRISVNGGSFTVSDGSDVTAANVEIGISTGGDGTILVTGTGSTLDISTSTDLGLTGSTGTLRYQSGASGDINGTIDLLRNSGNDNSQGHLDVFTGATLQTDSINVGQSGNSTAVGQAGTIEVTSFGSELTMSGASTLTVGDDLNPNVNATVTVGGGGASGGTINTGTGAILFRNTGQLILNDAGVFNANGDMTVDGATVTLNASTAELNMIGTTLTATNDAQLNFFQDSIIDSGGTWILQNGADYNTDSSFDDLDVGYTTDGTLTVENSGSSLNLGSSSFNHIGFDGATGIVTIRDSATATFGQIDIADDTGNGTTGTLNIESGAQVTAGSIDMALSTSSNTVTSELNISGVSGQATLTLNGSATLDVGASGGNGTATINLTSNGRLNTGTGTTVVNSTGLIDIVGGILELNGDLTINGGEVRRQSGILTLEPASAVTLNNSGVLDITSSFNISQGVVLTVNSGSTFSTTGFLDIGNSPDGAVIVDGAGSSLTVGSGSYWGRSGATALVTFRNDSTGEMGGADIVTNTASTAIFQVESGADLTFTGTTDINDQGGVGSSGLLSVSGPGSTVTMTSGVTMQIGQATNGTATMDVLNGGTFTKSNGVITLNPTGVINLDGGSMVINQITDAGGAFNYLGGSLTMNSDFVVGLAGLFESNSLVLGPNDSIATSGAATIDPASTLTIDGGSFSAETLTDNGSLQLNSGTLAITGAGGSSIGAAGPFGSFAILSAGQNFVVTNTLSVDSGSILVVETGASVSAGALAVSGEVVLDGAAAVLGGTSASNDGLIRGNGTITADATNNATGEIRAGLGDTLTMTGANGTNAGKLNLQYGTMAFSQALTNGASGDITGRGTLMTGGGGLANDGDVLLSSGVTDVFGAVANQNAGRVIISGNADVTFWDDVANSGALFRVSAGSSVTVFGDYSGDGMTGAGDKYFEGAVSPGFSPAAIGFGGDVYLAATVELNIELGGTIAGDEYDQVNVEGVASLEGTLNVTTIDLGDGLFNPELGDHFEIITATGEIVGEFDTIFLPTLDAGLFWDLDYGSNAVTLDVLDYVLGDLNGDGLVNGFDVNPFVQALTNRDAYDLNGYGINTDEAGDVNEDGLFNLGDVKAFKLLVASGGAAASSAGQSSVPEPASGVLALLMMACAMLVRSRR